MKKLILYCKSYRNDVLRVKRLAESVARFNAEQIPFYVSAPAHDAVLFKEILAGLPLTFITDEEIVHANPALSQEKIDALPGGLSQQIVKSEFWRLGLSESYLCVDSDCLFIRPFTQDEFISPDGYPYTVIHEAKELLQFAIQNGMERVKDEFHKERNIIMGIMGRKGHHYDYGPPPMLWSSQVWAALDENFLKPRNMNFYDAIVLYPGEILWYGEAMLKYRPIPLLPVEPYFKFYHYERQFIAGKRAGETLEGLAKVYAGVCYQSAWEKNLDFEKKPLLSRLMRWIRRRIFRKYR
jgi:hypothetical protein